MVAACGEAVSVEGTKRTNLIAAATSAFDPQRTLAAPPDLVCRAALIVCECPENCTIQRVQLDFFHFSALRWVSAQVYCKI